MKMEDDDLRATPGKWECADPVFAKKFPHLAEGLCDPWWADGTPRETWTLTIRFGPDDVSVGVNDKSRDRSTFTAAPSLERCLQLIESMAEKGKMPWRLWKPAMDGRSRRGGKSS